MNKIIQRIFDKKTAVAEKLSAYGFIKSGSGYLYRKRICADELIFTATVSEKGEIAAEVTDAETGDLYTLYLADEAEGSFVGSVREEYERVLTEIAVRCFCSRAFDGADANGVIAYVRGRYGDEPEFLWESSPDSAIWRRKDNRKWYGVLLKASRRKLGLDSDEVAEIIDLRIDPAELDKIADGKRYFRGYHMNKRSWVSLVLDGSVNREELFCRVDESYRLALKKSGSGKKEKNI
ncbi:MAG: hypothetical protein HFE26_05990 [Clostridia bacterium]|nr:hypothetical protein [Clostridia bacterium]